MESQPQNPEFRINPENFHPCMTTIARVYSVPIIDQSVRPKPSNEWLRANVCSMQCNSDQTGQMPI